MKLTKDQVNEIFKDVDLKFWGYYKYSFTLFGIHEPEVGCPGWQVKVTLGGDADSIYRMSFARHQAWKFRAVDNWNSVLIESISKGGVTREVFNHYNPLG